MSSTEFENISFDLPKNQSNVIKVIGVGGGGSNAINHMFQQGIKGVDFVICNTDAQALENSSVPNKIQLGVSLTEGLGAGANPEIGEQAAVESFEEIKRMLDTNTKMVFITAGMGGGTGTGAAPIIAQQAKELDILTVGIVTSPFQFEGKQRNKQAQEGVEKLRKQVDSLIVINNNKLREVYGNLGFKAGFSKADEVLATAARGIAEVITHHYTQNIDLRDAKTVLSNSGTAIMGSAQAAGSNRASEAIRKALDSPLLNDNKITGAKNVLLLIVSGREEITLDEIGEINDHIQEEAGQTANIIMGVGEDENLEEAIAVTIIATGFDVEQQDEIVNTETKKIIHTLEDEQRAEQDLLPRSTGVYSRPAPKKEVEQKSSEQDKVVHTLSLDEDPSQDPKPRSSGNYQHPSSQNPVSDSPAPKPIQEELFKEEDPQDVTSPKEPEQEEEDFQPYIIRSVSQEDHEAPEETPSEASEQFTFTFDLPRNPDFQTDREPVSEDFGEEASDLDPERPISRQQPETPENPPVGPSASSKGSTANTGSFEAPSSRPSSENTRQVHRLSEDEKMDHSGGHRSSHSSPGTEGQKRYSLGDYMEVEEMLSKSKPEQQNDPLEPKVIRQLKEEEVPTKPKMEEGDDPFDNPIPEGVVQRAEERRSKMKAFNYKFRTNLNKIDDIERQPAYKRAGIQLEQKPQQEEKLSRTSLGKGEDDEINFRRNNSFLHDNVD